MELDLDLDSEHNDDDFESDSLLSDAVDRAGSADAFQWSLTLPVLISNLTEILRFKPG